MSAESSLRVFLLFLTQWGYMHNYVQDLKMGGRAVAAVVRGPHKLSAEIESIRTSWSWENSVYMCVPLSIVRRWFKFPNVNEI